MNKMMETKIKVASVRQYTTTDRKTFTGQGAKQRALGHQKDLDKEAKAESTHKALVNHLHDLLGLGLPPKKPSKSSPSYEDDYEDWKELLGSYNDDCLGVLREIDSIDSIEDMGELAYVVSSFFFLIGRQKWNSIARLLDKEKYSYKSPILML